MKLTDGNTTVEVYKIIYGIESLATLNSTPTIDPNGGDAWFDFETLGAMLKKEIPPSELMFTDNDYLQIDNGELSILLSAVSFVKALIDIPLTWNFTVPEDFCDELNNYMNNPDSSTLFSIFDYIDSNDNMTIEVTALNQEPPYEWNNPDPFLEFLDDGEAHLKDFVNSLQNTAFGLLKFNGDIKEDLSSQNEHDITSGQYIDENIFSQEILNGIKKFYDQLKITFEIYEYLTLEFNFDVLKNYPERFSDLKKYFPTCVWYSETQQIAPVSFPDYTFGGFFGNIGN